ncbi:MAG: hypothetical protein WC663_00465 [Patescibacteria group bacterium]|jgi:hypothetical protein
MHLILNVGSSPKNTIAIIDLKDQPSIVLDYFEDKAISSSSITIALSDFLILWQAMLQTLCLQARMIPVLRNYLLSLEMTNLHSQDICIATSNYFLDNFRHFLRIVIIETANICLSRGRKKQIVEMPQSSVRKAEFDLPMFFAISIGKCHISLHDFFAIANCIFECEGRIPNDPREKFLKDVREWENIRTIHD